MLSHIPLLKVLTTDLSPNHILSLPIPLFFPINHFDSLLQLQILRIYLF